MANLHLDFVIEFFAPFRVSTGNATGGLDAAFDRDDPLPPSSLKGLMSAAARNVLELPAPPCEAVFGTARSASPWAWASARLTAMPAGAQSLPQYRVAIDEQTKTARRDHLFRGDAAIARTASFSIELSGTVLEADLADHVLILRASARAVKSLGAHRRRGLGWAGITDGQPFGAETVTRLMSLKQTVA